MKLKRRRIIKADAFFCVGVFFSIEFFLPFELSLFCDFVFAAKALGGREVPSGESVP